MRKYLFLFFAILLLMAWQGDSILLPKINHTLVQRSELRMRQQTGEIANRIHQALSSNDSQHIESILREVSSQGPYRFQIINDDQILSFDSTEQQTEPSDQSNKAEIISLTESQTSFVIRNQMMFSARKLDGKHLKGILRVGEPIKPINDLVKTVRNFIWLFALLAAVAGSAILISFAKVSLSPLNEFANVARMIGVGKYDAAPSLLSRNDNWSVLGDAFRHMQEELTKREISILDNSSRLQAVLSSMIEGVLAIDPKGRVMLANGAACDMLQISHSDIFGRYFIEIFRIPELNEAIEKTQRERSFFECEFQTRDLPRKVISARVSVLSDTRNSKIPGIAIVLHNVTDLRQLETLRRDFVANVSHELKTPLASIKAYAETLKMGAINDDQKNMQFVEHIESQADLLNKQIQDLLQLARVESGQKNWEIAPISINELCQACIDQFASEAESQKIEIKLTPSKEQLYVKADKDGIRTILTNLISNALHYTGAGGHVEVKASNLDQFVKIEVVDDGIGISSDHHARIFERFYRVDKARSREKGGTGLGLSIVKHLCQAFGGSVELESLLGEGSRFIVKIPNANRHAL